MKKGIAFFVIGSALAFMGFWVGRATRPPSPVWTFDLYRLDAYKDADPCIQTALFIERQSYTDRTVEPFSPYRLPVGGHLFGASSGEIAQCAMEIGDILMAYTQAYSLSRLEQQAVEKRLLGVVEILCSSDFQNLPPSLSHRRQILLSQMEDALSPEYEAVKMNIAHWCNFR